MTCASRESRAAHRARTHPARGPTESAQTEAKDIDDDSHIPQTCQGPVNVVFHPFQVITHRLDSTEGMDALPSACNTYYTATCYKQVSQANAMVCGSREKKQVRI